MPYSAESLAALHQLPAVTDGVLRAIVTHSITSDITAWSSTMLIDWGIDPARASKVVAALSELDQESAKREIDRYRIHVIPLTDERYPALLREIPSPPPLLYVRGEIMALHRPSIAIVGTRTPSTYALHCTERVARGLAESGIGIISGLAFGIDAVAHQAAVKSSSPSIAVMGTGITEIYPPEHDILANDILDTGGALVTEQPLGASAERHHFPQRNRIISGLSRATWLVEAPDRSGALITMKFAVDQNRDGYVLPGDTTRTTNRGSLSWLRLGATPAWEVQHFSDTFPTLQNATPNASHITPNTPVEREILANLTPSEPRHIDEIAQACRLESSVISATLAFLELQGYVRHHGDMRYTSAT